MYEFKEQDAYDFASFIHAKPKVKNGQLHFAECPYCHGKGQGNRDSFAIDLKTGVFNCLRETCGAHGNMLTLAKDFDFSLGNEVDEYYRPQKKYRSFKTPEKPIEPKDPALKYLSGRGIGSEVAKKYQLTVQNNRDNILVFPFYDDKGKLVFIKYRKTDFDKTKDNNKEWCEANGKPILFGMWQCNLDNKTLIICEGQLDSLSVAQAGIENAVSVPTGAKGFTWIPYCWDWMNKFDTLIIFGDHEKGRITLLNEIKQRFTKKTIKHVREEDYSDCKDANEILQKYGEAHIRTCIENAVELPTKNVISMAKVEDVNIFDIPKLPTGIKDLDMMLYGGLPFGGVTLIAGKSGEGKSTLASFILANALDMGKKCFAYSGELPNYMFKAWFNYQLAGRNHVITTKTKWGFDRYILSKENIYALDKWYEDSMFLYDNNSEEIKESETKDLLEIIEEVIAKHGVEVVLIDNLMTALDLEISNESDKYERQSKFVKALTRIALKYNVLILLVAHKRKNNFNQNDNDEVSGSSDITNLGMITLSYERGNKKDIEDGMTTDQRKLKLSKNRLFGKIYPQGWILDYDEKSKRIYGNGDDVTKEMAVFKLPEYENHFEPVGDEDLPWSEEV